MEFRPVTIVTTWVLCWVSNSCCNIFIIGTVPVSVRLCSSEVRELLWLLKKVVGLKSTRRTSFLGYPLIIKQHFQNQYDMSPNIRYCWCYLSTVLGIQEQLHNINYILQILPGTVILCSSAVIIAWADLLVMVMGSNHTSSAYFKRKLFRSASKAVS